MGMKKEFNKWLENEWKWILEPLYLGLDGQPYENYLNQKEKTEYLEDAFFVAIGAKSISEIQKNKDKDRNWYWAALQVKDFKKQINNK